MTKIAMRGIKHKIVSNKQFTALFLESLKKAEGI